MITNRNGMKKLIIVRHGNTFSKNDTPTRVGARTDLSLVEREKSANAAKYLMNEGLYPNKIYSSPLKRTMETAQIIKQEMGLNVDIVPALEFREIDYGPDENQKEDDVLLRLGMRFVQEHNINENEEHLLKQRGKEVIRRWDEEAIVPYDWIVDIPSIKRSWKNFAGNLENNDITLVVTSNGIIRFAPCILNESYESFCSRYPIKVSTGGICIFESANNSEWNLLSWNNSPPMETCREATGVPEGRGCPAGAGEIPLQGGVPEGRGGPTGWFDLPRRGGRRAVRSL